MASEGRIARSRLRLQGVAGARFATVESAATGLLALQAQDFHAAKWGLALRSTGRIADVDQALADLRVIRSWPMRGTLLVVARDDARWLTELLAPRSFAASAGVWRRDGLVEGDFDRARDVVRGVLGGRRILSRKAVLAELDSAGVATGGGRGSHLLRRLAGDAIICFGPPVGTEQTFGLLAELVPEARRLERDEALAELARRYVAGHAPVTVRDLAWWSGLTLTDARRAVALAGDDVEIVDDVLLVPPGEAPEPVRGGDVRLLPAFDELLLGYSDRTATLPAALTGRVVPYSNGLFAPTLVVDGVVSGIWRRSPPTRSGPVRVEIEPFEPLAEHTAAVTARRAGEYARALGRELDLAWA